MSNVLVLTAACLLGGGTLQSASIQTIAGTGFSFQPANPNSIPVWSGGALLALDNVSSANPAVDIRDLHGAHIGLAIVSVPGAKVTGVRGLARTADGTIVAGGWTTDAEGKTAEMLAWISPNGSAVTLSRVGPPFAPRQLAVAPDGSLWVQGFIGRNPEHVADPDPAHGVLRHFDASGKLIGSFLPEAQLDDRRREMKGYLGVTGERVGWISWAAGASGSFSGAWGSYIEVAGDGSTQQYPLPAMDSIEGFVLTSGDLPVAAIRQMRGHANSPEQFSLMTLDRERRAWAPILASENQSMTGKAMLGGSGDTLAIWDVVSKQVSFFSAHR